MADIFEVKRICGACGGDSVQTIRTYSTVNGELQPPSVLEDAPCHECTDGLLTKFTVEIPQLDDILDKCNDILNKCNDILEQVS